MCPKNFNKVETNTKKFLVCCVCVSLCVCMLFQNNICENKVEDVMSLTASELSFAYITQRDLLQDKVSCASVYQNDSHLLSHPLTQKSISPSFRRKPYENCNCINQEKFYFCFQRVTRLYTFFLSVCVCVSFPAKKKREKIV